MSKQQIKIVGACAAAAILITAGVAARSRSSAAAASAPKQPAQEAARGAGLTIAGAALAKNPIATAPVRKAKLSADLQLVGSVSADQNAFAIVGPLVAGRVVKLRASLGDVVRPGQVLAEIESAEVGQAQARYLSARARLGAAEANLRRERDLSAQKISSQREREVAEAQATSEAAELRAAVERMKAFGLTDADVRALAEGGGTGGRVPLRAPIGGTIVWRQLTLGQAVERATDAFKIMDLRRLWVLLDVYEKDLTRVHVGQKVRLRTEAYPGEVFHAQVAYVNPLIDEKTRTASVRITFDNPEGKLRPGQFVTARLIGDPSLAENEVLVLPRQSVATVDGQALVFVKTAQGFDKRAIELGPSGGDLVEARTGVREGEEVATDGAFLLKSELLR